MAQHDQPVIIVKKHRGGHGGHHGGAWKVTYADFVTAMMAFFLVMWLVAQSKPIKASIGGYFRDPGIFDQQKSNGAIPGGNGGLIPDGVPKTPTKTDLEQAHEALKEAAERIHEKLDKSPEFKAVRDQVEITLSDEGLRIQLLETSNSSFFDSGSPTLKGDSVKLLKVISAELAKQNNEITIEGHTDSRPYVGGVNYTNWELSADRANAARRVMQPDLKVHQLRAVRGYADTMLKVPSDPNDARNRRVSIVVRNTPERSPQ